MGLYRAPQGLYDQARALWWGSSLLSGAMVAFADVNAELIRAGWTPNIAYEIKRYGHSLRCVYP